MSDIERSNIEIGNVFNSFVLARPYRGVAYSNLQMYGPDISEEVDQDCLVKPVSMSTYWPGGLPNMKAGMFGTFLLNQATDRPDYSKITGVRTTLLSLDLSKRALRRWAGIKADHKESSGRAVKPTNDQMVPMACEISQVPFASAILSEVVSHRRIKAGQMVAHLYFPSMINNPRFALQELQEAQRATIAEEQI